MSILRLLLVTTLSLGAWQCLSAETPEDWDAICPATVTGNGQYTCSHEIAPVQYRFVSGRGYGVIYDAAGRWAVCSVTVASDNVPTMLSCADPMAGTSPAPTQVDLDGDGVPELICTSSTGNRQDASIVWIYAARGNTFEMIGPTQVEAGETLSMLGEYELVDLDGKGDISIAAYPPDLMNADGSVTQVFQGELYALRDGKYTRSSTLLWLQKFERRTGTPQPENVPLTVVAGQYQLVLAAPGTGRKALASSVIVKLDGSVVIDTSDVAHNVTSVMKQVTLTGSDQITVEVRGDPGDEVVLFLERGGIGVRQRIEKKKVTRARSPCES